MPLTFDMSLAELETYQGINPRPDDFDAFWDEALAEMREVDPQIEIVAGKFPDLALRNVRISISPVLAVRGFTPSCISSEQ